MPKIFEFQSLDWVDVDFDLLGWGEFTVTRQFQSLDWVDVDFDSSPVGTSAPVRPFQSLDWVDVDFDWGWSSVLGRLSECFNPSTGLMLISTWLCPLHLLREAQSFQSLDWVDVDFDVPSCQPMRGGNSFNPSTGLMLISTQGCVELSGTTAVFQSLDWVDVDFDLARNSATLLNLVFQPLDWVDVDFDHIVASHVHVDYDVSIPRLG